MVAYGGLWGLIGIYGDIWGPIGTYGDLWGPMGTYGGLWGPIGPYGDLWGPMGTFGDPLAPMGTYGDLSGPMGTYGVGGINFLHIHLDTNPPPLPPSIRSISDTSHILLYTLQKQHATPNIRLYTQSCHGPVRTLFFGLILCLVPMTPCETMLYWPSPN